MNAKYRLTEQQFQIFRAVNKLKRAGAAQVRLELAELKLALSTIATLLSRLEKKGLLGSEVKGRERIYYCLVDENSIRLSMVESLIATVFKGDPKALIAHLVDENEFDEIELIELQKLAQGESDHD